MSSKNTSSIYEDITGSIVTDNQSNQFSASNGYYDEYGDVNENDYPEGYYDENGEWYDANAQMTEPIEEVAPPIFDEYGRILDPVKLAEVLMLIK